MGNKTRIRHLPHFVKGCAFRKEGKVIHANAGSSARGCCMSIGKEPQSVVCEIKGTS